ncbi:hypothetical protein D3X12_00795 [Pseudomonas protegens]|jgi:hypothetical protein|nr:hypothetical protein CEP86_11830 [Pseudomonas protegens]PNV96704.1 hypothetical protein C1633_20170 [Pseudomonas protegens]QEZ49292.1 hypothetical protein D3X12_00795 [Pseudomonas protegens]QEZ58619.1 hypothetical protein D4N38_18685 [Pseudomonas protegens]QEZ66463.1 hypothetical protein D4N37_28460 [Pseudomonas protegens]
MAVSSVSGWLVWGELSVVQSFFIIITKRAPAVYKVIFGVFMSQVTSRLVGKIDMALETSLMSIALILSV